MCRVCLYENATLKFVYPQFHSTYIHCVILQKWYFRLAEEEKSWLPFWIFFLGIAWVWNPQASQVWFTNRKRRSSKSNKILDSSSSSARNFVTHHINMILNLKKKNRFSVTRGLIFLHLLAEYELVWLFMRSTSNEFWSFEFLAILQQIRFKTISMLTYPPPHPFITPPKLPKKKTPPIHGMYQISYFKLHFLGSHKVYGEPSKNFR